MPVGLRDFLYSSFYLVLIGHVGRSMGFAYHFYCLLVCELIFRIITTSCDSNICRGPDYTFIFHSLSVFKFLTIYLSYITEFSSSIETEMSPKNRDPTYDPSTFLSCFDQLWESKDNANYLLSLLSHHESDLDQVTLSLFC